MTILEALKESKENGKRYIRPGDIYDHIRWNSDWIYSLHIDKLMADDWMCAPPEKWTYGCGRPPEDFPSEG